MHRLVVVLVVALLALGGVAAAQPSTSRATATWRHFDVQVAVQPDGSYEVAERQELQFSGTFHQAQRSIPLTRLTSIDDVRVSEVVGGREVPYASGSDGQQLPRTFSTSASPAARSITFWFDLVTDGVRTFVVRYTVHGATRVYDQGDQVWWKAIYAERPGEIAASSVTVSFPVDLSADQLKTAWYRQNVSASSDTADIPQTGNGQLIDARTVRFDTGALGVNQGAEVRVQVPHGLLDVQAPPWQSEADRQTWLRSSVTPVANFLAVLVAAGLLAGTVAGVAVIGFRVYSRREVGPVAVEVAEPPSDLPAPLVGTLVDGHASPRDAVAALVDMAQRGLVQLNGEDAGASLTLLAPIADRRVRGYERRLLEALFGYSATGTTLKLSEARRGLAAGIRAVRRELTASLVAAGLFESNPLVDDGRLKLLAFALTIVGFFLGFWGLGPVTQIAPASRWLGFAAIAAGVLLQLASRFGARRSLQGALEAGRWQAFERYLLRNQSSTAWPEAYLPYAIAFGLERSWLERMAREERPSPTWFSQSPTPVVYAGDPVHSASSFQPAVPSGIDVGSPQAWSDALASLINSAASAIESGSGSAWSDSSWSSSGGSSSDGGGFSGGGDSGGGGGGGGSGSFS